MSDVPELVVRVDYEIPPTRGIFSMYFLDVEGYDDERYKQALRQVHKMAIVRAIRRKLQSSQVGERRQCKATRFIGGGPICYQPKGHNGPHIFECGD